jgi:D-aspartate ligase
MFADQKMQTSTPAVILGGLGHNSLCIARSLGRLGVPVYSVDSASGAFASFSRYCKAKFCWDESLPAAASVQFLLALGRRIGQRSILIATTDEAAAFIAENAQTLRQWFIFPSIDSRLVHSLSSKKEMYHLATKLGIVTPKAIFPRSRREVLAFLETAELPIMLKGIDGNRLSKRCGQRMFIAQTESDLLKKYDAAEDLENPNLMLQEYIPGGDQTVCGLEGYFNESSDCIFAVTGKKLRQWPAYMGVTTLGICLKIEAIEKITREFMKAIAYKGILDIGYRYDARDGVYKLLDVNPRIGCTFRLFAAENGMDVARALYLDLTGQRVAPSVAREGRKWIVEDLDALSSLRYLLDRKLTLRQWVSSFRGIQETAFLDFHDPLPFLAMCLTRGRQALRWIGEKRFRRRARQAGRWQAVKPRRSVLLRPRTREREFSRDQSAGQ